MQIYAERIIEKIGLKWAHFNGYDERADIKTGIIDGRGFSSPGRCYISQEDYERAKSLAEEWHKFIHQLSRSSMPQNITCEKIKNVRELLELPEPKEG